MIQKHFNRKRHQEEMELQGRCRDRTFWHNDPYIEREENLSGRKEQWNLLKGSESNMNMDREGWQGG